MNWGEEKGIPGAGCTQESDLEDWRNGRGQRKEGREGKKKEKDSAEAQRMLRSAEDWWRSLVLWGNGVACCRLAAGATGRWRSG
jgi:hypothetical protein